MYNLYFRLDYIYILDLIDNVDDYVVDGNNKLHGQTKIFHLYAQI